MNTGDGAGETVYGIGSADAFDVLKHPVEHANLGKGRDNRGDHLNRKEGPRWNLHVMSEFEVGGEFESLHGCDIAVGDEYHVGDGTAGEECAADKLTDEIEGRLLICDGHDDADRDEEDGAYAEGEEETVPWEVNGVAATCQIKDTA